MEFGFSDEQRMLQGEVGAMLRRECTPAAVRESWNANGGTPSSAWRRLGEMGVIGMCAGEAWGGFGMRELDLVLVLEESGRVALPEPLVETAAVGVPMIEALGSSAMCDRWLGAAAAGRLRLAVGLGEPVAYRADLYLLAEGDTIFAATPDQVSLEPLPSVDGGRPLFAVRPGRAAEPLAAGPTVGDAVGLARDRAALGAAAQLLGLSRAMIDMTVTYLAVREQFGRAIGSFQAVKHRMADALIALEFARPLVHRAAYAVAEDEPDRAHHVSMAKAYASDAGVAVAKAALQCHGAIGYSYEYDLHLWMKRAWALAAAWGDADWHRARIGQAILGQSNLGDPS